MSKLTIEWDSYEAPSYGFPYFDGYGTKKYGIVGGLGVVSDEVLRRISDRVNIYAVSHRHLRGKNLPLYEEIDGYKVIRSLHGLYPDEAIKKSASIFQDAGIEFNGVHSSEIPYIPFLSDYSLSIPELMFKENIDLICAHDWMGILGAYKKSKELKVPLVAFLHSLESGRQNGIIHTRDGPKEAWFQGYYAGSRTIRDIEVLGLKKSHVCFTVGTNMVKELIDVGRMHGIPPEDVKDKVYPIHHGVDTRAYQPLKNINHEYDVLFIGRFSPVKGVMELLDATKILKHKHPDIKVKLIGGGELEGDIARHIKLNDLERNVSVVTRWVPNDEKCVEINKAKMVIAPSKYEPHGQVDLEAAACGRPCINGTGGFMERMIEDVTAVQCDPFAPKNIAEKIDYLLSNSEKAEQIGKTARCLVEKYFDWDERAKIYPPLFEAVLYDDPQTRKKALDEIPLIVNVKSTEFGVQECLVS